MAEDTMENMWGVKYITYTENRCGRRSFVYFQADVEKSVPGFTLHSVQMCGTDANAVAISLATNYDYNRCLFGLGCYIGGDERHQSLSTSAMAGGGLSLPKAFADSNAECRTQTVPLPYHVPCQGVDSQELQLYENRCLLHLHQRLVLASLVGLPYKALLLEYVLGGSGGQLSTAFLKDLGNLLSHFDVVVVADEILTGGRTGPSIAMTPTMPSEFLSRVRCITLGKFVGCGMVLTRKTKQGLAVDEPLRGFSTQAECGLPSKLFEEVVKRINAGMIETRRANVLKLMNCLGPDKNEDHWGRGLQIYTTYSRSNILYGLRNRCLPRLEESKLRKNGAVKSKWNRSTVCQELMSTTDEWIRQQQLHMWKGEHSFMTAVLTCVFDKAQDGFKQVANGIAFRPEDVSNYLGARCATMAAQHNAWTKKEKGKRSNAKADALISRAILTGIANTKESRLLYRKRVTYGRTELTIFDGRSFDIYKEDESVFDSRHTIIS